MRTLYTFGEAHGKAKEAASLITDFFEEYGLGSVSVGMRNIVKLLEEYEKDKRRFLTDFLKTTTISILFAEGLQDTTVLHGLPYRGKVVYLDVGFAPYEEADAFAEARYKEAEKKMRKSKDYLGELKTVAQSDLEIVERFKQINQLDRERHWANKIDEGLDGRGLLICGKNHLDTEQIPNGIGKLPDLLREKNIDVKTLRMPNDLDMESLKKMLPE